MSTPENSIPMITRDMAGTWLDGSQGWHNKYRVVDRAVEYGFKVNEQDSAALDRFRTENYEGLDEEQRVTLEDGISDLSHEATEWLESRTPYGYTFEWDAGELALMRTVMDHYEVRDLDETCDGIAGIVQDAQLFGAEGPEHAAVLDHVKHCEECHLNNHHIIEDVTFHRELEDIGPKEDDE